MERESLAGQRPGVERRRGRWRGLFPRGRRDRRRDHWRVGRAVARTPLAGAVPSIIDHRLALYPRRAGARFVAARARRTPLAAVALSASVRAMASVDETGPGVAAGDPAATAEVVVCGAGIAGIAAAHELAVRRGVRDVVLVDELPPLTLTSDKSSECYRDWWPQPAMARLMSRSIELMEELAAATGNAFAMNRNGYAYMAASREGMAALAASAERTAAQLGEPLRRHGESAAGGASVVAGAGAGAEGWPDTPWERLDPALRGADLVTGSDAIRARFPFLAPDVGCLVHARRCGWLSAQQLGMALLERAQAAGTRVRRARLTAVERDARGVSAVRLAGPDGGRVATRRLLLAAGPGLPSLLAGCGLELPLHHELHAKVTFEDDLGLLPRHLPLMIWVEPLTLEWSAEERAGFAADPALAPLLGPLPPAVHFRPEGGAGSRKLLLLWAFDLEPRAAVHPPAFPEWWPEVVVRGIVRMVPAFATYLSRMRRPFVDGGYYTKAPDNLPVIGATELPGLWLLGALSGYGIMASMGAAELLAEQLLGGRPPGHAADLLPSRFADARYREALATGAGGAGQL
jgi:glycine/D-amino acid oxidase-like deaminating enzyme